MAIEIDFLAIGDGSKSGDAIAVRYGDLRGPRSAQTVLVIDGGTKEAGAQLCELVKKHYATTHVDFVFSTHPDADHVAGLTVVLDEMSVGTLLMHQPWNHASEIGHLFENDILSARALGMKLARALQDAKDLEVIAKRKGVRIEEPFAGTATADGSLIVLGPTREYYQSLICDFRRTPEAKQSLLATVLRKGAEAAMAVAESLQYETLDDNGVTSAENNSSVILLIQSDGEKFLLTGDAGIPALTQAIDFATSCGIDLSKLRFFQVPHHGSRRNIGPSILNRLVPSTAYISVCAQGEPKHPSRRVTNALNRRGAAVYATKGTNLFHNVGGIPRQGYGPVGAIPFFSAVESVDE